jgi:nucleotidyltransferase/DNA polymerase involved in DNA repair
MTTSPHIFYVHQHGAGRAPADDAFEALLDLCRNITPVVEALPPDAALLDVGGAVRYFDRSPAHLATRLRVRALAQIGTDLTVGIATNPLLARIAAHTSPRGAVRILPDRQVPAVLGPLPVSALPGAGPATARTLAGYGLDTIGDLARTPPPTLQRILGVTAGRQLHDRAHGLDPTPVRTKARPRALPAEHRFARPEIDTGRQRHALLALAYDLGDQLRHRHESAGAMTLTVRYATGPATTRTRTLAEPTDHTAVLAQTAHQLHAGLGLQRARIRSLTLRADDLRPSDTVARQLLFDPIDDRRRRLEAVTDQVRTRFASARLYPASVRPAA